MLLRKIGVRTLGCVAWLSISLGLLGCGGSNAATLGDGGVDPEDPLGFIDPDTGCLTYDSTFDAIQSLVFRRSGCTASACHGESISGGLDLRIGQAYDSLLRQPAVGSSIDRVVPGSSGDSYLYHKLQAATDPGNAPAIAGAAMPVGEPPLTDDQLEAVRLWILGGAPETGSVGNGENGSTAELETLLGACLPDVTPVAVEPLKPPAIDKGVQFNMPEFPLVKKSEREVCFAQWYDFSDQVPAQFQDGEFIFINGTVSRQDAQSHHLTLQHSGLTDPARVNDAEFGDWTCKGGASEGTACDPINPSCGEGLCGATVKNNVACIGYGPPDASSGFLGNVTFGGLGTPGEIVPPRDGAFRKFPIRGIIYWNSHAFNLTQFDHKMHARMNALFTDDLRLESVNVTELSRLYAATGQPPFTVQTYCGQHTAPLGAQMVRIASHNHKRGIRFTVDLPDGTGFYESLSYSDPLTVEFDPPLMMDAPDSADRTFKFCSTYNNGVGPNGLPDPETVTRLSRMPDRATCTPTACAEGKVGEACNRDEDKSISADDNATCDTSPGEGDGMCDACPITAGVTTEDEMMVLSPTYLVAPTE